ncbi:MAG TPA: YncE family protein [Tepidisphaeraceae bacterium]|jgi:DNA-binding beta-propeller fold protein YncE|nr:YncE family protein [Tepidisphaeraceae bacterium]
MRLSGFLFVAGLSILPSLVQAQPAATGQDYKVVKKAKVGGAGGFDYVYADADGRKLYVPRSGRGGDAKSRVNVFDLDTLQPTGEIPDTNGVHGVAVDPKSGHGFSSSNPVVMFDTKTLATIKTIPVQGNPDGIFFEPATERIYVLSHRAPNVSVIDGKDGSIVGTIDLGGAPEQGQSDGSGHAYIDIEDKDNIAVVDTSTMKVTGHYDLAGKGAGPAGLGLDAKNQILFAFCHEPNTCVILSAADGKILSTLPIGNGTDGGGFNPNTMEAFSSQRDGTLTIIKENSPTSFEVEQNVQTMPGAKTCTLDTKTNQIFLITAEFAAPTPSTQPAPQGQPGAPNRGGGRGQMVPDSFTIIQVGK